MRERRPADWLASKQEKRKRDKTVSRLGCCLVVMVGGCVSCSRRHSWGLYRYLAMDRLVGLRGMCAAIQQRSLGAEGWNWERKPPHRYLMPNAGYVQDQKVDERASEAMMVVAAISVAGWPQADAAHEPSSALSSGFQGGGRDESSPACCPAWCCV